ncbi:MAG: hybrid sensor histidine kinase/response regulator [Ferrovibrionaceae bacterium]
MDKARLIQRLMATFVAELEEHVRALERDLLALEKGAEGETRRKLFEVLFRTAHSLKGAAGSVGVAPVEAAAHLTEEVLSGARDGRLPTDAAFFARLLPVVDAIGDAGRRLRDNRALAGGPLDAALRGLAVLVGDRSVQPPAPPPPRPPAAPPVSETPAPGPAAGEWAGMVRVPAEKLDALMAQGSELLLVRHRAEARQQDAQALLDQIGTWQREWRRLESGLATLTKRDGQGSATALRAQLDQAIGRHRDAFWRIERGMQRLSAELQRDRRLLDQVAVPIDQEIRRARMLPFAEACEGLDRVVRDLAAAGGRTADFVVEGHDIELDRSVLDGLKDSLLHLVRNAVDHGIEPAEQRAAAGKPSVARIVVSARRNGARVEVQVADDGRGLDIQAIRSRLVQAGLPVPDETAALARAIFAPGLSTATEVTALSGRGVGLDVVKTAVEAMRGTVDVEFTPGHGTRFMLGVPLTLTSVRAVLAAAGGRVFAIEAEQVLRVIRPALADLVAVEGRDMLVVDARPVPVVRLADLLGSAEPAAAIGARFIAIVLDVRGRRVAVVVDEVRAEREIVIRSLGRRLRRIAHVGGGTILPDGRVGLVLNAAELVDRAMEVATGGQFAAAGAAPATEAAARRLLVVDDSVTIRTLVKSILEGAGYEVMAAPDGAEAWAMLLEKGADLVVSDVEMPRMDGFTLTETIRASPRFRKLPVILVTAMESESDKARGLAAGADAYQVKSGFDQSALLSTIGQLL